MGLGLRTENVDRMGVVDRHLVDRVLEIDREHIGRTPQRTAVADGIDMVYMETEAFHRLLDAVEIHRSAFGPELQQPCGTASFLVVGFIIRCQLILQRLFLVGET